MPGRLTYKRFVFGLVPFISISPVMDQSSANNKLSPPELPQGRSLFNPYKVVKGNLPRRVTSDVKVIDCRISLASTNANACLFRS
jgi:hypothetical protein